MWSKWAPPQERSRMVMMSMAGIQVGVVVSLAASGVLAANVGWESVFYVFGAVGCAWSVLWLIFVRSTPAKDPFITKSERSYIEMALEKESKNPIKKIPWRSIMTSPAVWAIFAAQFAESWGFLTLHTQLPLFLNDVLDFNVAQSGIVSSLPYIALAMMAVVTGFLADYIQGKGFLSNRNTRRLFTSGAFFAQAILRMCVVYFLHPVTSMALIVASAAVAGFSHTGFSVNYLEIAPQFSGILVSVSKVFACMGGIISPILSGYIVTTPVSLIRSMSDEKYFKIFFVDKGLHSLRRSLLDLVSDKRPGMGHRHARG